MPNAMQIGVYDVGILLAETPSCAQNFIGHDPVAGLDIDSHVLAVVVRFHLRFDVSVVDLSPKPSGLLFGPTLALW
jgi:S-ribosylhomocysteine lyase LuxS involved in autoinducer biosynthesis